MQQLRDDNQPDLKEIICDVVVRLATRDSIDVLRSVILSVSSHYQGEENEEVMDVDTPSSGDQMVASVSELGKNSFI
jgi:hypothetical protein